MIRIGKIVASHGLHGAVIMTHIAGNNKWLKKDEAIFLELKKESYIPFFVTYFKASDAGEYTLNLEDINTAEAARRLVGKHVYVNEELLKNHVNDTPLLWIGFTITDKTNGILGHIEDVFQTPAQWLAKTTSKGKEVLIPLIPEIVKRIDLKAMTVYVEMPEGLLEVYI